MVKKLLVFACGLLLAAGASAQWEPVVNPTVPQNMIRHWTGTGESKAVICITWNDAVAGNVGLAWGVQWNGTTALMRDLMDTIAAYDSRLSITWNSTHTYINNLTYVDTTLGLNITGVVDDMSGVAWWMYNWKDASDVDKPSGGVMGDNVADGDFVDWLPMDPETYETEAAEIIYPATDPNAAPLPAASTIAASDIRYWVGTGAKQAVLAVNWADTALAWGYRFDGEKSVSDMLNAIAADDPRFSIEMGTYGLDDIVFVVAEGDTLRKQAYSWWESTNNGTTDAGMGQPLADGDFEKWAEPAAGVEASVMYLASYSYWMTTYVYPMEIHAVNDPNPDPLPEEGTIAASEILYWVGNGANRVVMAVNWADTALAWGYRFDGEKTVADMMDDIAEADNRFSYTMDGAYLGDIVFVVAEGDTLRKQAYSWWESKHNGVSDMGMAQPLADGDFEKWAEPAAGVVVDSSEYDGYWYYTYVYPMEVHPVSVPVGIAEVNSVNVSLYPNPAAVLINVTFEPLEANSEVELFDMAGRRVAARPVAAGTSSVQLPVSQLNEGVYVLRVAGAAARVVVSR